MKLIDYIVNAFVMVDDFCKIYYPSRKLRTRGPLPKLADSEAITMEIVGEYLGFNTDESIYDYFSRNWYDLFPNLPDRSNFVRQCVNSWLKNPSNIRPKGVLFCTKVDGFYSYFLTSQV